MGRLVGRLAQWARRRHSLRPPPAQVQVENFSPLALLDAFPAPVILLDAKRVVVEANHAAQDIFGPRLLGHDLAQALRHPAALEAASGVINGGPRSTAQIALSMPVARQFELYVMPVNQDQSLRVRAAMVLLDITSARQVEQMRADFVANVSHELRSPLASLSGFIETLKGAAKEDPEARARFLDIMEGEARRMGRLIDDLLSLSRVEANEHVRPTGKADIAKLLSASCAALGPRAEKRGITFALDCEDDLPVVAGDNDQLSEVFQNLLDNALKYGAPGKPVNVTVRRVERIPELGGKGLRVSVNNSGEPIDPEHLPRLTERFYRVDKSRSRDIGGTGLGLAIVKHIVSRHRGRLIIESGSPEGTTFNVFLPEWRPSAAPANAS